MPRDGLSSLQVLIFNILFLFNLHNYNMSVFNFTILKFNVNIDCLFIMLFNNTNLKIH